MTSRDRYFAAAFAGSVIGTGLSVAWIPYAILFEWVSPVPSPERPEWLSAFALVVLLGASIAVLCGVRFARWVTLVLDAPVVGYVGLACLGEALTMHTYPMLREDYDASVLAAWAAIFAINLGLWLWLLFYTLGKRGRAAIRSWSQWLSRPVEVDLTRSERMVVVGMIGTAVWSLVCLVKYHFFLEGKPMPRALTVFSLCVLMLLVALCLLRAERRGWLLFFAGVLGLWAGLCAVMPSWTRNTPLEVVMFASYLVPWFAGYLGLTAVLMGMTFWSGMRRTKPPQTAGGKNC